MSSRLFMQLSHAGSVAPLLVLLASLAQAQGEWEPTFAGGLGTDSSVGALAVFDDGSGPALFAGGLLTTAGGVAAAKIAKWDGVDWTPLGGGLTGAGPSVHCDCLAVFDDGSGAALYAGGVFDTAGGVPASFIAKWDGTSWSSLGAGVNGQVVDLAVHDDGSGEALYAAGLFTTAGGLSVNRIARWDGSSWSALGTGMNNNVRALEVFDDGSGPALYAGGQFATAGGVSASRIAKWNGSTWQPLGSGTNNPVNTLAVYDDGSGAALHAGGFFTTAGGAAANFIAKWDGLSWTPLGSGTSGLVTTLGVYDDGAGAALFVGGQFTAAGGVAANSIARWDGTDWSALGTGLSGGAVSTPDDMVVFDDGCGEALYVGGPFTSAGGLAAEHLAEWRGPDVTPPLLACPPYVFALDDSTPGEVVSFSVQAIDCEDPAPAVVCVPASGSFFSRGLTVVTCTATDAAGNQAIRTFPVIVMTRHTRPK